MPCLSNHFPRVCMSMFYYSRIRKALRIIKYYPDEDMLHELLQEIPLQTQLTLRTAIKLTKARYITFVPCHRDSHQWRGYNPAEVIANKLSQISDLECRAVFCDSFAHSQASKKITNRSMPLFQVKRVVPGRIILVDDVITTGLTLQGAHRALIEKSMEPYGWVTMCRGY